MEAATGCGEDMYTVSRFVVSCRLEMYDALSVGSQRPSVGVRVGDPFRLGLGLGLGL